MANGRLELLQQNLNEQIDGFEGRRSYYGSRALGLRLVVIVFSATITVLLGIKGIAKENDFWLADVALILSAAVTALGSWEGLVGYRELWIQFSVTRNRLRSLQFQLDCWKADGCPDSEKMLRAFSDQYQKILDENNTAWLGVRRQGGESESGGGSHHQDAKDK